MENGVVGLEERVRARVIGDTETALGIIEDYFKKKGKESNPELVRSAFLLLGQSTKIMQMNQVRVLTERSQALRYLPYLADAKIREEYIKISNPQIALLLPQRTISKE